MSMLPAILLLLAQAADPERVVLTGTVLDPDGRPVAGADLALTDEAPPSTSTFRPAGAVFPPPGVLGAGKTGDGGRFRLPGAYREPAFLFVEGDGLAFEGHRIGPGGEPVELKARRIGEPAGPPMQTLPTALPREEELALARRLVASDLSPLTGREVTRETFTLIRILPRVDFERAWELAESHHWGDPWYDDQFRMECARALLGTSLEEAETIAETMKQPFFRSQFYRLASDALPAADRAHKLSLLDKALVHARAEGDRLRKLDELGMIGYRLLDLGEKARGTQILREGQKLAETLPRFVAGQRNPEITHGRGRFAAKLARIDAPAALALAASYGEPYSNWYQGGVALALADRDPAGSERACGLLKNRGLRDGLIVRAVGRMAGIDRERARRLVEALDRPRDQAMALGAMAASLAGTDPKAAGALIDEALRRLEALAEAGGETPFAWACVAAGHLLPTAERIDPELLRRGFWRAVAMRPPRPSGGDPTGMYEEEIASLAITLARYDRAVARQVLEPAPARARSLVEHNRSSRGHGVFAAAAAIDPAWAARLADSLPDDTPGAPMHPKAAARRVVADVLASAGPERWEHMDYTYLHLRGDSRDDER